MAMKSHVPGDETNVSVLRINSQESRSSLSAPLQGAGKQMTSGNSGLCIRAQGAQSTLCMSRSHQISANKIGIDAGMRKFFVQSCSGSVYAWWMSLLHAH
ncbi:hypothetical protein SUGI_0813450 [Cryptomeria japonica]|nr:hypothetical protein SUGI_0813450 [Cryptomeria japonica]